MDRQKGVAFCGLACAVCGSNANCAGCRDEGCKDKDWCINLRCCKTKGLNGCWECGGFPCEGSMLDSMRIKAFAGFIREFGEERLLDCLERNEQAGIVYHYPGELTGDYDTPKTEEGIWRLILSGECGRR